RSMNFLNKNWGAITQTLAAYSGLRDVVKGSVEAFAEMDQEMNNVRKYTGQTIEEVQAMNEKFKEMDTRTPREQLNQLAGSAGRLGITGEQAIMDFVYAADQINIALGDDLGKGAVDKIGKLTMAFGEDDRMGLRDAMLSTGSAVNELAQNSAAQAGYLVDFAARLSGVGVQAWLTQAQILGLGAAMDENMQRDEMAATALSQIITKMTTDSETFARIAGKNVEEFANLVRTDMNSALMQFFESMNKKGGFTELAPLFEEMGLDGTRAIGVLSTLASKIDDVRKHQELATKAYQEHTSVEAEAAIQNDTYQAKLEKARKAFSDLRIELGEKLLPVASVAISTTSMAVRVLNTLIDFISNNYKWILTLTASIAAYNTVVHWAAIRTRVLTFVTETYTKVVKAARLAVIAFNTAMKSNPWGLIAAGITLAVGALISFITRTKEAAQAQDALKDAQQDANRQYVEQEARIRTLERVMRDEKVALDERRRAIEKLKEIIPGYNAMLTDEGKIIKDNRDAIEDYLKSLRKQILMKVYQDKIVEIIQQQEQLKEQQEALIQGYNQRNVGAGQTVNTPYFKNLQDFQKYVELGEQILDLRSKEDEIMRKIGEESQAPTGGTGDGNSSPGADTLSYWQGVLKQRKKELAALRADANATAAAVEEAAKRVKEAEAKVEIFTNAKGHAREESAADKARRDQERKANDAAKAETERQLAELTHRYAMGKILYCDYVDEQERIQLEGIERRMLIYRTESLEYQKLNRQREELLLNGSEESRKLSLTQMKQGHEQRLATIEEQAWRENMTEQQKNEMVFREDMRFLDEQRILYRQGTLERINLEREIEETDQQYRFQREQYYQQQLEQVREQYLGLANERVKELALKNLDDLHAQGLLKEREYQEAKLAIEAKYANYETNSEHDQRVGANALKVAQSNAKQKMDNEGSSSANLPIVGDIMLYQSTMEQLKQMYQNDEMTHAQYLAAKQQATAQFCASLASQMQTAYNSVNQVLSAASSYFSAQQEYETAQVQKKYEKQIEAAGNNQKKVKKLQEKQQKEEAAIKSKYAKRAAAIQMAQAVAQTAISAINAYSSAAAIPVVGYVLAPVAAAMAIAAGMLQIATIKKQQQAQEAGYYEGGFTGGRQYRKEAGVVHEGEFVANHQAVNNPNVLPFLNFLDQAQRNNTIGSLTAQDVSKQLGTGASFVTPIINVAVDNSELKDALGQVRKSNDLLLLRLKDPIDARVVLTGPDGLDANYRKLNQLKQ
ncbi:MAG: phage tail tape measure protein, partial [Aeriscardovia sp.]|nr:phage tail tape measure protein [Aeriscardovia sp.]